MGMPNWQDVVRTVAPALATALGGPLAGVAAQALSTALLGKPDATQDELAQAVASATPDTLLKLKQAEMDFTAKMKELDIQLEQINAGDRASARGREIAVKDQTPQVLAVFSFLGFFGILVILMFYNIPDKAHDALMLMLGALGAIVTGVVQYYFGSSSGSAAKTEVMASALKNK